MATIEVDGETRTIEPRPPRSGEFFRVRPGADRRKDAWVLDNDLTGGPGEKPRVVVRYRLFPNADNAEIGNTGRRVGN
jgi:hypothetical protein